jgi:hypothetical protein
MLIERLAGADGAVATNAMVTPKKSSLFSLMKFSWASS